MITYHDMVRSGYNKAKCAKAFHDLAEHPKQSDFVSEAIIQAMPVLGCLLSTKFSRVIKPGTEEYDEVLSSVPVALFEYFTSDRFYERYYDDAETLFSFLFGMIRFEVLNVLKRTRRELDPSHLNNLSVTSYFNLESSAPYTEYRIFTSQLPGFLRKEVLALIRFDGDDRIVCETILNSMLASDGIPWCLLVERFGLTHGSIQFFVDHVVICVKLVLQQNRSMINHVPSIMDAEASSNSDKISYEIFHEGMHGLGTRPVEEFFEIGG